MFKKINSLIIISLFVFTFSVSASFPTISLPSPTSIAEVKQMIEQVHELKNQYEALEKQLDSEKGRHKFLTNMALGEGAYEEIDGNLELAENAIRSLDDDLFNTEAWNTLFFSADNLNSSYEKRTKNLDKNIESLRNLFANDEDVIENINQQSGSDTKINLSKNNQEIIEAKRDRSDDSVITIEDKRREEIEETIIKNPEAKGNLEERLLENRRNQNSKTRLEVFRNEYALNYQKWFPNNDLRGWKQRSEDSDLGIIDQVRNLEILVDKAGETFEENANKMTESAYREANYQNILLQNKILLTQLNTNIDLNELVYYYILEKLSEKEK